jgi:hypothetical protein
VADLTDALPSVPADVVHTFLPGLVAAVHASPADPFDDFLFDPADAVPFDPADIINTFLADLFDGFAPNSADVVRAFPADLLGDLPADQVPIWLLSAPPITRVMMDRDVRSMKRRLAWAVDREFEPGGSQCGRSFVVFD